MLHSTLWEIIIDYANNHKLGTALFEARWISKESFLVSFAQTLRATSRYMSKMLNGDEDASEYRENLCYFGRDLAELLNQIESFRKEVCSENLFFNKAQQLQIIDCITEMLQNNTRYTYSPRSRAQMQDLTYYLLFSLQDRVKIQGLLLILIDRMSMTLMARNGHSWPMHLPL